jgi:hypothetical protein
METVSELCFNQLTPIKSTFVDVSNYKYLRFNIHSTNNCEVLLIFSDDGHRDCNISRVSVYQSTWLSHKIEIAMKFLKIVSLTNREYFLGENSMEISCQGYLIKKLRNEEPKEPGKKTLMQKLKASYSPQTNNKDNGQNKLPELIFRNQLLSGGYNNKVVCIPKGIYGEVLTYDVCGNLVWIPLQDLIRDLEPGDNN